MVRQASNEREALIEKMLDEIEKGDQE